MAVDTNSSAKSSSSVRDMSPQQKHRGSRATRNSVEKLNNSSESSRSQSLENRPASAGVRRNSKDSDKPPLKSKSPEGRRGSKSVLDNVSMLVWYCGCFRVVSFYYVRCRFLFQN